MASPRRALIVIDAQQEYFDGLLPIAHPAREHSVAQIGRALDIAGAQDLPVVVVQHELPSQAPVFAAGSATWELHSTVTERAPADAKRVTKQLSSVFAGTDVAAWLAELGVDTVTLVGYMTNNCVLATAAGAEELGLTVEVLSDATGAIHLANEAGKVSAEQLHTTLMVLLQSNWAAVADTDAWSAAVTAGSAIDRGDLGSSAAQGAAAFG